METWKNIIGYDSYQISDHGRVKNKHGRFLKYRKVSKDMPYFRVGLSIGNKQSLHYIHRLVLSHFNPDPNQDSLTVDHVDGNHTNNNLSNLRWLTSEENSRVGQAHRRNIKFISETEIRVTDKNGTKLFRLVE